MEMLNITTKIRVYTFEECTDKVKKLIEKAKDAAKNAYAPYSKFYVGAAVILSNGEILTGNNQENAAYPSGLCAERVIAFYVNANFPNLTIDIIALAVYNNGSFTLDPCSPCGGCRQALLEIEKKYNKGIKIVMYGENNIYEADSIKSLLPLSFDSDSLLY